MNTLKQEHRSETMGAISDLGRLVLIGDHGRAGGGHQDLEGGVLRKTIGPAARCAVIRDLAQRGLCKGHMEYLLKTTTASDLSPLPTPVEA